MTEFNSENAAEIPQAILMEANEALADLCPSKSKDRYEIEYNVLQVWMKEKNVTTINETVLLAYFNEKSKVYMCSSLWSKYSMIKKMFLIKKNMDIGRYHKLISFLKNKSVGHEAKKAKVLSKKNVIQFVTESPDETYLMIKVALIFGIYGACRREELTNMLVDDIEDRGSVLVVTLPKTKTNKKRVFTVVDDDVIMGLEVYRKYALLRPGNLSHRRLFVQYRKNTCTSQPVGKNTFSAIPKKIAEYLKLPNPEQYTGHTFRRTSATLLADSGADITSVKRHGGWKSTSVAEGYLEDSVESKNKTARLILGTEGVDIAGTSSKIEVPVLGEKTNQLNVKSSKTQLDGISFNNIYNCIININK